MNDRLSIAFSIADYCFERTRTIGQMNLAIDLVRALSVRPEISKLVVFKNRSIKIDGLPDTVELVDIDYPIRNRFWRIFWDQIGVYIAAKKYKVQWLFLPKGFSSFIIKPPIWLAAYIHDVVPVFYKRRYPEDYNGVELMYFNRALKCSLKNASIIFTNSEFVITEVNKLIEEWQILNRVPEISIGAGFTPPEQFVKERSGRIFVLASKWRHKRTDLAIEYLSRWQKETRFAGGVDFVGGLPDGMLFPSLEGWRHYSRLPEDEYRKMFNSSRVVVYFSEYEGFGMPPVEAVIHGIPAVYSDIGALREVMAGAGFSFRNESFSEFSKAMNSALVAEKALVSGWANMLLKMHDLGKKAEKVAQAMLNRQVELMKQEER